MPIVSLYWAVRRMKTEVFVKPKSDAVRKPLIYGLKQRLP